MADKSKMYQAVIMAGGTGSRMQDLTTQIPKALLPIANKPMVWYPVNMLQKAGYDQAMVVVTQSQLEAVRKSLIEICQVKIALDFVAIPDDKDWGTADALRHVCEVREIKNHVLVISCDTIMDKGPLEKLEELHATKESAVSILLAPEIDSKSLQVPGDKSNKKVQRDIFAVEFADNKEQTHLIVMEAEADIKEDKTFSKSFLKRYPAFQLYSDRLDAHVYIIQLHVLGLLKKDPSMSTIKGELLRKFVRKQHHRKKDEEYKGECHAYTLSEDYCIRANSIMMYCEANRTIPRSIIEEDGDVSKFKPLHLTVRRGKANIGASIIGEGTTLGKKANIKNSTIGRHCVIHNKAKITNSIIMDNSVIEEGCNITGSLICQHVTVGEKSHLTDTIIVAGQKIDAMSSYTEEEVSELYDAIVL